MYWAVRTQPTCPVRFILTADALRNEGRRKQAQGWSTIEQCSEAEAPRRALEGAFCQVAAEDVKSVGDLLAGWVSSSPQAQPGPLPVSDHKASPGCSHAPWADAPSGSF